MPVTKSQIDAVQAIRDGEDGGVPSALIALASLLLELINHIDIGEVVDDTK